METDMLKLNVNVRNGLAPLRVTATVSGVGPEDEWICIVAEGDDFYQRECVVQRQTFQVSFLLENSGEYLVFATEGEDGEHSNSVTIEVK